MKPEIIKLSKRVGKQEIRLAIFENKVSVYFNFPIRDGNCKIAGECKDEIVEYLKNRGLSLDQEGSLIVETEVPLIRIIALITYAESLLKALNDAFSRKTSANYFIGTVESDYRDLKKKMANVYNILGRSTASIVISHLKKIGYQQVVENKGKTRATTPNNKSIFRRILDHF
jgi:hypothetical protein